jgi:hypothetical protein
MSESPRKAWKKMCPNGGRGLGNFKHSSDVLLSISNNSSAWAFRSNADRESLWPHGVGGTVR